MEPGDVDAIYRWENDPMVWTVSASHQPFSRHAVQKYIDENSLCDIYTSRQLRLMADNGEASVGCVDLYNFDPHHRRAAVGILVDPAYRGEGYGTAIISELLQFAAEHLNMHQIYCTTTPDNTACIKMFERCGFSRCGILNDWVFDAGTFKPSIMLQKILS